MAQTWINQAGYQVEQNKETRLRLFSILSRKINGKKNHFLAQVWLSTFGGNSESLPVFANSALYITGDWSGFMSATVITDTMVISAPEGQQQPVPGPTTLSAAVQTEVEFAICDCCGLTEECTPAYIERIRERYFGKWICGLCAEAIKDEIARTERLVSAEEAMTRHMNFCKKSKSPGPPTDPIIHLISAMRQILRKSLESRSTPSSPTRKELQIPVKSLARSGSCLPTLTGWGLKCEEVILA